MDRNRLPSVLQILIADIIVTQCHIAAEGCASEPLIAYHLSGSFLSCLATICLQIVRVDKLYISVPLENALIMYFSSTKQFYPLHVLESPSILLKDSISQSRNDELGRTIREEFFEKRQEMIEYVTAASLDDSLVKSFMTFIELELPNDVIPPMDELRLMIKASTREKVRRLNIEKNLLTENESQTDQVLNNGEVSSIIRSETNLIQLHETVDAAFSSVKRHYFPVYLSYAWKANELDEAQVKSSMVEFVKSTLHLPIEPYEFLFRIFTYKSGHGAAVAVIPANICAPTLSNVKVIVVFSSFSGLEQDCKLNVDHTMDLHTALWRNIESYLEETVHHNESVSKKTSTRSTIEYYLGGYATGGVFAQLTAIKVQDACSFVVATTLDTVPLFQEGKLVPLPTINAQKALILNLINLNDVKIKAARRNGFRSIGTSIPFTSADNGLNEFHDYQWLQATEFSNRRFVDPVNLEFRDQEVQCLPICKMA